MTTWTSGYVAEIGYTHGYYRELCPTFLNFALLLRLYQARLARPIRYLELGFGQGLSLNIHAAAHEGEFWGTDFNPLQTGYAKELADASGANLHISDRSFADIAIDDALPELDIVALHGVWSWISDENREHVISIIRRKLAVGGICYLSYNCTPGWSPSIPLRDLMVLHASVAGAEGEGIIKRIDASIGFAQRLADAGALYFKANPSVVNLLKQIEGHNRNYLAHEYFNADWHPMPFAKVARMLGDAKLSFIASANLLDHIDLLHLGPEGQKILSEISSPIFRQSIRDYFVNEQFRRDIFIKGARSITLLEQASSLRKMRFVLTTAPENIEFNVKAGIGQIHLQEAIYKPLIAAFAREQHPVRSFSELESDPDLRSIGFGQLAQAVVVLAGTGHLHPAQSERAVELARARTSALNRHLCERAAYSGDISFLASPVTGGGIPVPRFHQLFIRAKERIKSSAPHDWAQDAWNVLSANGERLVTGGRTLETPEENLRQLRHQAAEFAAKRLSILEALAIA
jgi:hypothetical protein